MHTFCYRILFALAIVTAWLPRSSQSASCVWKVTAADGKVLYLGGSIHALESSDYPLPAAYNKAFDASSNLAFESDPKTIEAATKGLVKAGRYPQGDNLKNHVDPRTYAYIRRFFALFNVPEKEFNKYRPWFIDMILESPSQQSSERGVEEFLAGRARTKHKPIQGLESLEQHMAPYAQLSDRESEALLLVFFINLGRATSGKGGGNMMSEWRHGQADALAREFHDAYQDFPAFADRILTERNRTWIPRIEQFIQSGQTFFVVAGAGHMGGPQGVVALLRGRGYNVEQM